MTDKRILNGIMASHFLLPLTIVLCLSFTFGYETMESRETKTITTPSGKIMGKMVINEPLKSLTYQYRRIPYAQPPIGNLRFANPKPVKPWKDTLDATEFGPSCMQILQNRDTSLLPNTNISEDCLLLNIYVPSNTTKLSNKPVMVFIHGGRFLRGQGMLYDGSILAIYGDLIIVTINYRLGIWGFLSTGYANCRGNFGLLDQRLALQWVKNNIKSFGGDPDLITIFGESAGGFSVSLHSILPDSKGLFSRSMAHSGSSNSVFAVAKPTIAQLAGAGIGMLVGCVNIGSSTNFVECMRSISPDKLLQAFVKGTQIIFNGELHYMLAFAPVIDGVLITKDPAEVLSDPTSPGLSFFKTLDVVNGDVSSEGSLLLEDPLSASQAKLHFNLSEGIPFNVLCNSIIQSVVNDNFKHNLHLKAAACAKYKSPRGDGVEQSRLAVDMFSDLYFFAPGIISLNSHTGGTGKTYQFLFSRKSKYGFGQPYPGWFSGAGHGSELEYLFGIQKDPETSAEDLHLAEQMLSFWSNFARTGNPNIGKVVKVQWPGYNKQDRPFIDLNAETRAGTNMYKDRVDFWAAILL